VFLLVLGKVFHIVYVSNPILEEKQKKDGERQRVRGERKKKNLGTLTP